MRYAIACLMLMVSIPAQAYTLNFPAGTGNISQAEIQGYYPNFVYPNDSKTLNFCHLSVDSWVVTRSLPGKAPFSYQVDVQYQRNIIANQTAAGFDFVGFRGVGQMGKPPQTGLPFETVTYLGNKQYFSTNCNQFKNIVQNYP